MKLKTFTATETILSKIPPNDRFVSLAIELRILTWLGSKLTYVWEQYLFHYVSEGGYTYLVMADDAAGR